MTRGKFTSSSPEFTHLFGEAALLRPSATPGMVEAQFSNPRLGYHYTHNWTTFPAEYFTVLPGIDWSAP